MSNVPKTLHGVHQSDWFDYESLRRSGKTNMWGANRYLCLPREEFLAIMKHYDEMADAWLEEFKKEGA